MAGILEMLFGPDGPGGKPGAVGNFTNSIGATGPDGLADSAKSLVKGLATLPITLAKLPGDFMKDPMLFTDENGRADIGSILFPDYRKEKKQQRDQNQAFEKARTVFGGMQMAQQFADMLTGQQPNQRGFAVQQAQAAGLPEEQINAALGQASAADQQAAQASQAAQGYGMPANVAQYVKPESLPGLWTQAKAAEATAAERNKPKLTNVEKKVEALSRARASGDPVAIAAAEADLLTTGKSSQPMIVNTQDPESGATTSIIGPASEVGGFESATRRDAARTLIDTADNTIGTIGQLRSLAVTNPEAFGAAGTAMRTGQGLVGQVEAFAGIQNKARAEIQGGKIEPELAVKLLENFRPEAYQVDSLMFTLAYAQARLNNPTGVLTDNDFEKAFRQVGANGPLTTSKSVLTTLDILEASAKQKRKQAVFRAGKGNKPKTALEAAIAGEGKAEQPKKKFGRKNAEPGTTRGGKIPDSELRLLENSQSLEELSDADYGRWRRLKGLSDE